MTDLTPREVAARRLLTIASLEKLLSEEKRKMRAEEGAAFTRPGQREVAELPDGTPLGNVRLDKPTEGWKVTDLDAWLAWVDAHAPEHVVTRTVVEVAASYTKAVLDAEGLAEVVDTTSGEVLATRPHGVAYVVGSPRLVVTPDKGAPEAVRRRLGDTLQAMLGGPETAAVPS